MVTTARQSTALYARRVLVRLPSLESYERKVAEERIIHLASAPQRPVHGLTNRLPLCHGGCVSDESDGNCEFFDTYWRLIYSVALKAGFADAEAQDIVQDTVVSVAKKMKRFRYDVETGSFKAWLLLITRSRIAERLRKRRLPLAEGRPGDGTKRTATVERIPNPEGPELDAIWESEWKRNLLAQAIKSVKRQVAPKQFQNFAFSLRLSCS